MTGAWVYLCRAVDKFGKSLDFMLSKRRNKTAATTFFARAMEVNGLPRKIVIGKSGANTAGITAINRMLKRFGCPIAIEMVRIEFLNDLVEQPSRGFRANRCRVTDHRTIKKRTRPPLAVCEQTAAGQRMLGFKSFVSASATLEGIEVANMIRKGQLTPGLCPFAEFAALAAQPKERKGFAHSPREFVKEPPSTSKVCDRTALGFGGPIRKPARWQVQLNFTVATEPSALPAVSQNTSGATRSSADGTVAREDA